MKNKRCGNCGSFEVKSKPYSGPYPWKDFPQVFLVKPILVFQCEICGETQSGPGDGKRFDEAAVESIATQVRLFIDRIVEREHCTQTELAQRVGVTPQYLSSLKNGANIPGFQTFNFLKVLAVDERAFKLASPSAKLTA